MPPDVMSGGRRTRRSSSARAAAAAALLLRSLLAMAFVSSALAVDAQGAALLSWKRTLRAGDEALPDWKDTDASPCRWSGVSCDASGHVTGLTLQFVDLHGGVPGADDLSAVAPTLSRLVLTGTNLTGPIPPQLGDLPALTHLDLSNNALTGSIPTSLCRPGSKLESLYLNSNHLEGAIPDAIGNLTSLREFIFYDNQLEGTIPASIGKMTSLEVIRGGGNKNLQGALPPEIGDCGNLTMLGLAETSISGPLPASLGKLKSLDTIAIYTALLSGPIPPELGECSSLAHVYLYENALSLFRLPRLSKLLLIDNNLSGEIPLEIGNCTSLVRFRASGNHLAGGIPAEIGKLGNLSFFDLSSNRLSGSIPAEIAGCRNLTFVDLHANAITGVLPPGIFHDMLSLQYLDLSYNSINGVIPSDIGKLGSLTKLVLGGNRLTGQIPPEIGSCSRLQLLDLGGNTLSGEIPASIGKIPGLEITLNLSCNGLSGAIPKEFAGLVRLGVLDVSHNQLSGDLQPLAALQNLVALNISFNNFAGRSPETPFFAKLPTSDVEGNPALCLSRCPGDASDRELAARRAAKVAIAVLLSAVVALLAVAAFLLVRRRRGSSVLGGAGDKGDAEMMPPWEVTLYQKLDISVGDVARSLTPANVIGQGWSGSVYRATVPSTGVTIAVKKFRSSCADDASSAEAFACEVGVLPRVRHRNIVRLLGWAANRRTRLLFYDYLPNGTLGDLLHGSGGGNGAAVVEWEVRLAIAVGVAEGLAYLHHDCVPAIVHRDVKADNILLGERYEACLADFGLARVADDGANSSPPPFAGSYGYIAPEYGCMTKITTKSDVYSFGVVLLEIITGRRPVEPAAFGEGRSVVQWVREHLHQKRDPAAVVDHRLQGRPDTQVQEMLQALGIALLCASARPEDRPTMKDVAALLRGLRNDDGGGEARKVSGGGGVSGARLDSAKWAGLSPTKPTAQAQSQSQSQSPSSSLAYSM
ncbi:hypothetical protein HU200_055675 [Digitaria exilis]|uniref:Protein kinase domain-containing protein n=1 Tax=Digitaria exilis TaxID=1010633 RepID=A0A835ASR3_9POAL|nr:hypothetical protein HU200_055675 [Digitaria exilis]